MGFEPTTSLEYDLQVRIAPKAGALSKLSYGPKNIFHKLKV